MVQRISAHSGGHKSLPGDLFHESIVPRQPQNGSDHSVVPRSLRREQGE